MILQWQIVSNNGELYQMVQFPINFSNTNFCALVSSLDPHSGNFHMAIQSIESTDTIKLYHNYSNKTTVIAIGY